MADKIYCYPDSDILKNKPGIKDKDRLLNMEVEMTSNRLFEFQNNPVKGRFGFNHLCEIHRRIFQDLYAWAGKPRTVNIGKGNLFCLVQNIPGYAESIFSHYYKDCMAAKDDPDKFITALAGHYADVNALHPFREGNGRSQREFTRELCLQCGYVLDLTKTSHEEMLTASIESFDKADNAKLEAVLKKTVIPLSSYPGLE